MSEMKPGTPFYSGWSAFGKRCHSLGRTGYTGQVFRKWHELGKRYEKRNAESDSGTYFRTFFQI